MRPQAACVLTSWPPLRRPPLLPNAELLAVASSTRLCPGWPFSCLQRQQPHKLECEGCCRRYTSLPQKPCHWQPLALFCCSHACCHLPVIPFLAFVCCPCCPGCLPAIPSAGWAPCRPMWLACRSSLGTFLSCLQVFPGTSSNVPNTSSSAPAGYSSIEAQYGAFISG